MIEKIIYSLLVAINVFTVTTAITVLICSDTILTPVFILSSIIFVYLLYQKNEEIIFDDTIEYF